MRLVLIYPPPWKIPEVGEPTDRQGEGPPEGFRPSDLDGDFFQMPYGIFTLGAAALEAGHRVKVINLSAYGWSRVEQTLRLLDGDVFGMSCYTANRRGVALVARLLKKLRPQAHVVVGGPHATALPKEVLAATPEIDSVVIGEGEVTLLEVLDHLEKGKSLAGVPGVAFRDEGKILVGPARERIRDIDSIPLPQRHYRTHLFMTSRGCPGDCTFCAKGATWGRLYRAHSIPYVLEALEISLSKLSVRMIQIKDDTFTTDRKRALELCREIRQRKLNFRWSCDTRADVLDEKLLLEMRLAGCERLSLGVESGSPEVLRNIRKRVKPEQVLRATEMAKRVGLQVRYFMMLGNRGETVATFDQTLRFLRKAQPHQALFSCLSVYPGTDDFRVLERRGWLDRQVYFTDDFLELKTPFDASEKDTRLLSDWFEANRGLRYLHQPTVQECKGVLERLGDFHAAHMDLAGAYYREGLIDDAQQEVERALELGYPAPGLAHNYLACIHADRGDFEGMKAHFERASTDLQHPVLVKNVQALRRWLQAGGDPKRPPLLDARHDFELLELTEQPALPGPLPADFERW